MSGKKIKFTPADLAERWCLCIDHVRALIRSGEVRAIDVSLKPGHGKPRYLVDLSDVLAFESRREVLKVPNRKPRRRKDPAVMDFIK